MISGLQFRHADADGDVRLVRAWRLAIGDPQPDALGDRGGALEPAAWHHHRELVAAVAGTDVEDADGTPQDVVSDRDVIAAYLGTQAS